MLKQLKFGILEVSIFGITLEDKPFNLIILGFNNVVISLKSL